MSNIEKMTGATRIVYSLLKKDRKSDAVEMLLMAYQCELYEAEEFVQVIEDIYDAGN